MMNANKILNYGTTLLITVAGIVLANRDTIMAKTNEVDPTMSALIIIALGVLDAYTSKAHKDQYKDKEQCLAEEQVDEDEVA